MIWLHQDYTRIQNTGVRAGTPILPYGAPSTQSNAARPQSWDYTAIIATPALGVETFLIGSNTNNITTAQNPGAPAPGPVPRSFRGVIDTVSPYGEDSFGGQLPRVTPTGTTLRWTVYTDRIPLYPFGNLVGALDAWEDMSPRAQAELFAGQLLTASVLVTANAMGLTKVGIKIRGRWIPQVDDLDAQRAAFAGTMQPGSDGPPGELEPGPNLVRPNVVVRPPPIAPRGAPGDYRGPASRLHPTKAYRRFPGR